MLKPTILILVISLGACLTANRYQEQDKIRKVSTEFMIRKLDDSRDIVAGLATEDFDLIAKSAQDLMVLSHEADWKVITTPDYLRMSSEFRGSAQRLRETAKEKNIDGATLAYFEVTLNCVRCHKYVRGHSKLKKLPK